MPLHFIIYRKINSYLVKSSILCHKPRVCWVALRHDAIDHPALKHAIAHSKFEYIYFLLVLLQIRQYSENWAKLSKAYYIIPILLFIALSPLRKTVKYVAMFQTYEYNPLTLIYA